MASMRHLNSDALATFIAVVDCGGFTAAADALGKTQAAVSIIVQRLEERVGKRLLDRSRRGVSLTAAGEILISYARRLRALEDEALDAVSDDEASGRIRLGMPDDYLEVFGAPVTDRFAVAHPKVQVEILGQFSRQLEAMVERGGRPLDDADGARDVLASLAVRSELLPRGQCVRPRRCGRVQHRSRHRN